MAETAGLYPRVAVKPELRAGEQFRREGVGRTSQADEMLCVVGRRNGATGQHEIDVGESNKALDTGSKCGACPGGHCHIAAIATIASSQHSLIDGDLHCRLRHVVALSRSKANSSPNDEEQQGC